MGIYYGIVDHKNKRLLWLGKMYAFVRFFNDHAPFTYEDKKIASSADYCGYEMVDYDTIVDFCNEADWEVEMMSDDGYPSHLDLPDEYERMEIDELGNVIPSWLADSRKYDP